MPSRLMGHAYARRDDSRHVIVTDPDLGTVHVRWVLGRAQPWRCTACGPMTEAGCAHTFSAGVTLAEALLGLTRVPELEPHDHKRTAA